MTKSSTARPRRRSAHRRVIASLATMAAVAAALVAFAPAAPSAEAVFSGSTGRTGCTAVNMGHTSKPTLFYVDLTTKVSTAQEWVRDYVIDKTHITTYKDSSQDTLTSIVFKDSDYVSVCGYDWYNEIEGGTLALTTCETIYTSGDCKQHTIRVSTVYTDGASLSQRRGLLCHESGHAFGLMHTSNTGSCMKYGDSSPAQNWDSSEIAQINANY